MRRIAWRHQVMVGLPASPQARQQALAPPLLACPPTPMLAPSLFPSRPALFSHPHTTTTTITHSLVHSTSKGRSALAIKIITSTMELTVAGTYPGLRMADQSSLDRHLSNLQPLHPRLLSQE